MGVNLAAFADFFGGADSLLVGSNSSETSSTPEDADDEESNLLFTFTVNCGDAVKLEIVDSVLIDPLDFALFVLESPVVFAFLLGSSTWPASSPDRFFLPGLPPPLLLLPLVLLLLADFLLLPVF